MEIKTFQFEHLDDCANLLIGVYNRAPWNCHWSIESSKVYLTEFYENHRFVGFTIFENEIIVGAAFCHERKWWTTDELFVDEFFISPDFQRKGYGQALLKQIENYILEKKLAGFTLLTNKYTSAPNFYKKNGFVKAEHVVFMYKEL